MHAAKRHYEELHASHHWSNSCNIHAEISISWHYKHCYPTSCNSSSTVDGVRGMHFSSAFHLDDVFLYLYIVTCICTTKSRTDIVCHMYMYISRCVMEPAGSMVVPRIVASMIVNWRLYTWPVTTKALVLLPVTFHTLLGYYTNAPHNFPARIQDTCIQHW